MAGLLNAFCQVWFGITLFGAILSWSAFANVFALLRLVGLVTTTMAEDLSSCAANISFRTALFFNPQIRITNNIDWAEFEAGGKAILLANHSSFMDFFIIMSAFPISTIFKRHPRTTIASALTKVPLLGRTMSLSGTFKVYFQAKGSGFGKADDENDYSVDRTAQKIEGDRMDTHLEAGGVVGVCPEGKLNKTPAKLATFRRGTFAQAIQHRAPIYGLVLSGCPRCWPLGAPIGGLPSALGMSLHKLEVASEGDDAIEMAGRCQATMQRHVDALNARIQGGKTD